MNLCLFCLKSWWNIFNSPKLVEILQSMNNEDWVEYVGN